MTPPTHSTPTKRDEAGIGAPSLGATAGYAVALVSIALAFRYPTVAAGLLLTFLAVVFAYGLRSALR